MTNLVGLSVASSSLFLVVVRFVMFSVSRVDLPVRSEVQTVCLLAPVPVHVVQVLLNQRHFATNDVSCAGVLHVKLFVVSVVNRIHEIGSLTNVQAFTLPDTDNDTETETDTDYKDTETNGNLCWHLPLRSMNTLTQFYPRYFYLSRYWSRC